VAALGSFPLSFLVGSCGKPRYRTLEETIRRVGESTGWSDEAVAAITAEYKRLCAKQNRV
jgi:hypothetical protein